MVGSKQYYAYETDALQLFVIQIDESNSEYFGAGINPPVGTTVRYGIPRNLRVRYARYVTPTGLRARNIPVCDEAAISSDLPTSITTTGPATGEVIDAGENVFVLKSLVGEIFRVQLSTPDTGLTDGD